MGIFVYLTPCVPLFLPKEGYQRRGGRNRKRGFVPLKLPVGAAGIKLRDEPWMLRG